MLENPGEPKAFAAATIGFLENPEPVNRLSEARHPRFLEKFLKESVLHATESRHFPLADRLRDVTPPNA